MSKDRTYTDSWVISALATILESNIRVFDSLTLQFVDVSPDLSYIPSTIVIGNDVNSCHFWGTTALEETLVCPESMSSQDPSDSSSSSQSVDSIAPIQHSKSTVKMKITRYNKEILASLRLWLSNGYKFRGFCASLGRYLSLESTNISHFLKALNGFNELKDSLGTSNTLTASPSEALSIFSQGFIDSTVSCQLQDTAKIHRHGFVDSTVSQQRVTSCSTRNHRSAFRS
jgi:hypothetical protein